MRAHMPEAPLRRQVREANRSLWAASDPIALGEWRDCDPDSLWKAPTGTAPTSIPRAQSQRFVERHQPGDPHRLDGNGDGEACESLP